MSCDRNGRACANNAATQNGIIGLASRYLNTLGNWSTYRDLRSLEQVPERLEQVTAAFFGLAGLSELARGKWPKSLSILGVIVGVHLLEQATGAVATTGVRLFGRGQPAAKYQGLIIRQSRLTPRIAAALNRLTGGRVLAAEGYYFHDRGRTWHAQSLTIPVKGTPRTITHIRSFSLPHREHFFDRPLTLNGHEPATIGEDGQPRTVPLQRVIEVIKGNEDPETIPGYIGSTNELENITNLGHLKRALFAANWFLLDESERDTPSPDFVDYDALLKPKNEGYRATASSATSAWPSTTQPVRLTPKPAASPTGRTVQLRPRPANPVVYSPPAPLEIKNSTNPNDPTFYTQVEGRERPVVVRRIVVSPLTKVRKADAQYYDEETGQWRDIMADDLRIQLARAVEEGVIKSME